MKIVRRANFAVLALAVLLVFEARALPAQTQKPQPSLQRENDLSDLVASVKPTQAAAAQLKATGLPPAAPEPRTAVNENNFIRSLAAGQTGIFPVRAAAQSPEILADPVKTAHAFLQENRPLFVTPSDKTDFVTKKVTHDDKGRSYVRVHQTYAGLSVFGAEMTLQVQDGEGVAFALSKIMTDTTFLDRGRISLNPVFDADQAREAAILALAGDYPGVDLLADANPELIVYSPEVLDAQGAPEAVWSVHVCAVNALLPNENVLVSAATGQQVMHYTLTIPAKYRTVYDGGAQLTPPSAGVSRYNYGQSDNSGYGLMRRWEEEEWWRLKAPAPPTGVWPGPPTTPVMPELNSAGNEIYPNDNITYEYLGNTYDFYFNHFGRISIDNDNPLWYHAIITTSATFYAIDPPVLPGFGHGLEVSATCNLAMENAYWEGPLLTGLHLLPRMYLGTGYAVHDVIGHEYTHGVTMFESGLIYTGQSAAINEGLSDAFGEWIAMEYANPNDWFDPTPSARWLLGPDIHRPLDPIPGLGEECVGNEFGPVMNVPLTWVKGNMKNPPSYGQPDRLRSKMFQNSPLDSGGAHNNAGVLWKLAYLLSGDPNTDPNLNYKEEFNGYTITGMGSGTGDVSAPTLFYTVQTRFLSQMANYHDLYYALLQAADNLGYNDSLKANLENACRAVEIAEPHISDAYTITYKDANPAITAQVVDTIGRQVVNQIVISDPSANGTLKVRKKPGFDTYPMIQLISSAGSFSKIFIDGSASKIISNGVISNLTLINGYARRVEANEIDAVKMTSYAKSWSLSTPDIPESGQVTRNYDFYQAEYCGPGELNRTSLYSVDISASPNPHPLPLKANLTGTGLYVLQAPSQVASVTAASKKWLASKTANGKPNEDVSYGGVAQAYNPLTNAHYNDGLSDPYFLHDPVTSGRRPLGQDELYVLRAGQFGTLATKGGSIVFSTFEATGVYGGVPQTLPLPGKTAIEGDGMTFSIQYNGLPSALLPTTQTASYWADFTGGFYVYHGESNSQQTSVKTNGGYLFAGDIFPEVSSVSPQGFYAQGTISEISARTRKTVLLETLVTFDPVTSITTVSRMSTSVWDMGGIGQWFHDIIGALTETKYEAGLAYEAGTDSHPPYADIDRVWGDACVQGWFAAGNRTITDPDTGLPVLEIYGNVKSVASPKLGINSDNNHPGEYMLIVSQAQSAAGTGVLNSGQMTVSLGYGIATVYATTTSLGQDPIFMHGDVISRLPSKITGGNSDDLARHWGIPGAQ